MSSFCRLFAVSCQPRHQGGTLGSLTDPFLLQDSESRSSFRPSPTDSHRPVLNRVYSRTTPVAQLLRTGRSPPVALHGHITAPQLLSVTDGRTPVGWGLPPRHVDAFTGAQDGIPLGFETAYGNVSFFEAVRRILSCTPKRTAARRVIEVSPAGIQECAYGDHVHGMRCRIR